MNVLHFGASIRASRCTCAPGVCPARVMCSAIVDKNIHGHKSVCCQSAKRAKSTTRSDDGTSGTSEGDCCHSRL